MYCTSMYMLMERWFNRLNRWQFAVTFAASRSNPSRGPPMPAPPAIVIKTHLRPSVHCRERCWPGRCMRTNNRFDGHGEGVSERPVKVLRAVTNFTRAPTGRRHPTFESNEDPQFRGVRSLMRIEPLWKKSFSWGGTR